MIDLLKKALSLLIKVAEWLPAIRRTRERNAIRRAIATHDEAEINRLFQQRRDTK